jgi:multicomponent Na+:H+ antiporter subunit D
MTKVTVYVMLRMMLTVFGIDYLVAIGWSSLVVGIAVLAIVAGSLFALAQRDLKKMLCYLIISEVGYMVGGAWLLNESGMIGAIYHIVSDALMTLCLFLAAGAIITRTRDHDLSAMKGLYGRMPLTMVGFTVGGLSMIGLPPTCGFVSKWYLIRGGIESGQWHYVAALLFASLINVVLFFRIFELAYFQLDEDQDGHGAHTSPAREEAPLSMLFPLLTVAASLLVVGIFNERIVGLIRIYISGSFS